MTQVGKSNFLPFLQKIRILSVESGAVSTLPLPIITAVREDFQQTCDGEQDCRVPGAKISK